VRNLADSGLFIALLDASDFFHAWASDVIDTVEPPFFTCEAVCAETAAVLGTADPILLLVGIANYKKGTTSKTDFNGNPLTVTNPVTGASHDVGACEHLMPGAGWRRLYKIDLAVIGPKSYLELWALFGFGATNFSTSTDLGTITGFESALPPRSRKVEIRQLSVPRLSLVRAPMTVSYSERKSGKFFGIMLVGRYPTPQGLRRSQLYGFA
jgi:hypothetical protein